MYDRPVLIDIETRSAVDLPKEGGHRYADHPTTELLTVAWIAPDDSRHLWIPYLPASVVVPAGFLTGPTAHVPPGTHFHTGRDVPDALLAVRHLPWAAHNAWGFDELVWDKVIGDRCRPAEWIDTVPWTRTAALPGQLGKIGEELRRQGKDKAGKSRMLQYSKAQNKRPGVGDLMLIGGYNLDDVELLLVLWNHLQHRPVPPFEIAVIAADREINRRGCRIDLGLTRAVVDLADEAVARAVAKVAALTGGVLKTLEDLRRPAKLRDWIARQSGRMGKSLARPVLEQLLRDWDADDEESWTISFADEEADEMGTDSVYLPPVVAEVLRVRFSCLRITSAKARVALTRVHEGRLRGLMAYGAAHTLRWGGRGIQVQNLPRPKETVPVWKLLDLYTHTGRLDPDVVQGILDEYGAKVRAKYAADGLDPPDFATLDDAASALVRNIFVGDEIPEAEFTDFVSSRDEVLATADYNAVEFRCAGWLADEQNILDCFDKGIDPYGEMANAIFGRRPASKKDPVRQIGKVVCLGCIYGMGGDALYAYGLTQGIRWETVPVTPHQCVHAFRSLYTRLAGRGTGRWIEGKVEIRKGGLWKDLEEAAHKALKYDEAQIPNGKIKFRRDRDDLLMVLPSGRPIRYRNCRVEMRSPPWGGYKKPTLVFRHPRGWDNTLTGSILCENASQATTRDLTALTTVNCTAAGLKVVLTVHDEVVCSVRGEAAGRDMARIMSLQPDWAAGFNILVEADITPRYAKSPPPGWPQFNYENGREK